MSKIITQASVAHQGVAFSSSGTDARESTENSLGFFAGQITAPVTTTFANVITPSSVFVKNLRGADLRLGVAAGVYTMRLKAGQFALLPLDLSSACPKWTITCMSDFGGGSDGTYLDFYTVKRGIIRVWFRVVGGVVAAPPAPPAPGRLLMATVASGATTTQVSQAVTDALVLDGQLISVSSGASLIVTDTNIGPSTAIPVGEVVSGTAYMTVAAGSGVTWGNVGGSATPGARFFALVTSPPGGTGGTVLPLGTAGIGGGVVWTITRSQLSGTAPLIYMTSDGSTDATFVVTPA